MIPKRESEFKAALAKRVTSLLPGWVRFGHADLRPGVPDWSLTGLGATSWWEFKHATPMFESRGHQELMCLRLEGAGRCRYVIWAENADGTNQRTLIVRPRAFRFAPRHGLLRDVREIDVEATFAGFEHDSVIQWIKKFHGGGR